MLTAHPHGLGGKKGDHDIAVKRALIFVIRTSLALDTQNLGSGRCFRRIGHSKGNGPPAIVLGVGIISKRSTDFRIFDNACVLRDKFICNALRVPVGRRMSSVDIIVKDNIQLLLKSIRANKSLGHIRLDSHTAGTVGNIRQGGGIDIGRYIRAAGGRGRRLGRIMPTGRNLFYLNLILEVTEDRIVFASFHQVHLVIAHDTLSGIKRCRSFFKVFSIDNHEGGLHVYVRYRSLVQIDRMLFILGIVFTIGFHPILTVHEVLS